MLLLRARLCVCVSCRVSCRVCVCLCECFTFLAEGATTWPNKWFEQENRPRRKNQKQFLPNAFFFSRFSYSLQWPRTLNQSTFLTIPRASHCLSRSLSLARALVHSFWHPFTASTFPNLFFEFSFPPPLCRNGTHSTQWHCHLRFPAHTHLFSGIFFLLFAHNSIFTRKTHSTYFQRNAKTQNDCLGELCRNASHFLITKMVNIAHAHAQSSNLNLFARIDFPYETLFAAQLAHTVARTNTIN